MSNPPQPPFEAVVFDMDGVLADSEPVYFAAFNAVLKPRGYVVTEALHHEAMGHGTEASWRIIADCVGYAGDVQPLVEAYDAYLVQALAEVHETLPGVRELIDALQGRGVPLGLASSSWPGWIEALLRGTGLTGSFGAMVSRVEVPNGKPAPDVYLEAARRLGIEPARCIAVEDTPTGIAAGLAAGMFTVQMRSSSMAFPPQPNAHRVYETLRDFELELLQ